MYSLRLRDTSRMIGRDDLALAGLRGNRRFGFRVKGKLSGSRAGMICHAETGSHLLLLL